jgi:Ca2+:H+ antiporter
MGRATEELAARSGPGIGGFLNVTFGNAPELIIAFFALNEGLQEVVKASLVGSILGNVLLVMGAAMLVGGLKRERQRFDRTAANVQALSSSSRSARSSCRRLRARARHRPAEPDEPGGELRQRRREDLGGHRGHPPRTYIAGLFFSLRTHKDLFNPPHAEDDHVGEAAWPVSAAS